MAMNKYATKNGASIGVPCMMLNFAIITLNGKTKNSDTVVKKAISLLSSVLMNN